MAPAAMREKWSQVSSVACSAAISRLVAHVRVPLYRNAYALTISQSAGSLLGMLYWVLAARLYAPEVVGLNSAAISALMFVAGVAGLYLDGSLLRFIPRAGAATTRLVTWAFVAAAVSSMLAGLAFVLGIGFWAPSLGFLTSSPLLMATFVLGTMASCIVTLQDGVLTGLRRTTWIPVQNAAYGFAKIALLVAFARMLPRDGILVSWIIPIFAVVLFVSLIIFRRLAPHREDAEMSATRISALDVTAYAASNYVGYLLITAGTKLLPLLVIQQAGSSASAYFYLPWLIVSSLQLVAIGMSASFVVEAAFEERMLLLHASRALIHAARLVLPAVAVLVVGAPYLLRVFGENYAVEGTTLLRLLALGEIPHVLCVMYVGLARAQRRFAGIIVLHASVAVLLLGLSYVFLGSYGIAGVGLAWLTTQAIAATVLLLTQFGPLLRAARA
jgi:O-antigen/teichoic acid export membrane protein